MVRKLMERIRFVGPAANRMSTTRIDGRQHVMAAPVENSFLGANAYWDGGQWMRYDVARSASLTVTAWNGTVEHRYAPAGANPIAWTTSYLATGSDSGWLDTGVYGTNWTNYSAVDATYAFAFRKLPSGLVLLRGLVRKTAALALPEVMVTLPVGYRPANNALIYATSSAAGIAEVRLRNDGALLLGGGGSATWTSLAGIVFYAEN